MPLSQKSAGSQQSVFLLQPLPPPPTPGGTQPASSGPIGWQKPVLQLSPPQHLRPVEQGAPCPRQHIPVLGQLAFGPLQHCCGVPQGVKSATQVPASGTGIWQVPLQTSP